MGNPAELLPGTLDLLILKSVSLGKLHGYGVLLRIEQISGGALQIQQGALYPALYRLEHQGLIESEWGVSDNNRRAKYYKLTDARPAAAARRIGELEPAGRRDGRGAARDLAGDLTMRGLLAELRVASGTGCAGRRRSTPTCATKCASTSRWRRSAACSAGSHAEEARAAGGDRVRRRREISRRRPRRARLHLGARPVDRSSSSASRMLAKYPGLTAVARLRVVARDRRRRRRISNSSTTCCTASCRSPRATASSASKWDQQTGDPENRAAADFVAWRGSLRSIEEIGAYRALDRNLITDDGRAEPVRGVEISAAAFRIARRAAAAGPAAAAEDERDRRAAGRGASATTCGRRGSAGDTDRDRPRDPPRQGHLHRRRRHARRISGCRSATACGCRCR